MFARVNIVCLSLVFALCASAASVSVRNDGPTSDCDTGTQQCCDSLVEPSDPMVSTLAGLLGVVLGPIAADVGLGCIPIIESVQCTSQVACCTGNTFSGLITVGCSPLNINL
ncbi:hypothetical protein E4T56_gene8728 [Termitomyces sp. T112]|nr:hypothetical protein E4T56_gene8728 [Termitomyces sp. T112]